MSDLTAVRDWSRADHYRHLAASALAYGAFLLLMLSLRPFNPSATLSLASDQGDRLNQIGFLFAGIVVFIGLISLADRHRLAAFFSLTWIGIYIVLALSVLVAPDPAVAARSVVLTMIGIVIASAIVLLPPDEDAFAGVCAAVLLTVLFAGYAGLILVPDLAIHGAGSSEPQHAGLWRGSFTHKNIAGPVMSVFVMFGIYLWRRNMRVAGFLIAILSFIFVVKTGSKTTNGLLPVAILVVLAGRTLGSAGLTVALYVFAILAAAVLTIGSLYSPAISAVVADVLGDPTFTGRTTLWEYGIGSIPEKLWLGTGYDGFWAASRVTGLEPSFEWAWDFRGIVHGHNNYLDMLLTVGAIAFLILLWALYIKPAANYVRACRIPANRARADLFMMVLVFLALLSFLETFFLRRVDPIWLLMAMAVMQLQVLARDEAR